eukprot:CAMPEP_0181139332 /NCGR_PEP_ID=MMETSP1071-20121207/34726_1 /TAXON_ID=35127 /ORGANISM="Thalassiosira sp., Strain NH16" /LENGTH=665 /DNA_ID=CAMNT_0023226233 /DNA_START=100 /DNA_END=2097 /DNA_ORIENTATION=-
MSTQPQATRIHKDLPAHYRHLLITLLFVGAFLTWPNPSVRYSSPISSTSARTHDNNTRSIEESLPRVTVIDSTMYNGEPVIFFRLAMLYDKVDMFYIIESNYTFDGKEKKVLYKDLNRARFRPYEEKIKWYIPPEGEGRGLAKLSQEDKKRELRKASMKYIGEDSGRGGISKPFVSIFSDVDEIITPNDIDDFQPGKKYYSIATKVPMRLRMDSFEYNLNWRKKRKRINAYILPERLLTSFVFDSPGKQSQNALQVATQIDSGFHLSNFFGIHELATKMAYSNGLMVDKNAQMCVSRNDSCLWKGAVDADVVHWDYTQTPGAIQKFHEKICNIQSVDPATGSAAPGSVSPEQRANIINSIKEIKQESWNSSGNLPPRVMVVDSIMYNGEPIVPTRLATLNEVVDRFYISEGTHSFSGIKKDALFKDMNAHIFEPYAGKIHWVVNDLSEFSQRDHWGRERSGRTISAAAMKEDLEEGIISLPFVIINTDADEIPHPNDIEDFQPGKKYHDLVTNTIVVFAMNDFYYNLNWISEHVWTAGHTLPGDKVMSGLSMNGGRSDRLMKWVATQIQGGYHMSYFLDFDGIRHKLNTFPHQELNREHFKSDEHIQMCVSTGHDLYNRHRQNRIKWDYKQAPLPLQKFHEEICKRQNIDPSTAAVIKKEGSGPT